MMVLIAIATVVADIVVVPEIPNTEAIRNGNVAVSVVEGSVLIATGQIAGASFGSASTTGFGNGLTSALVFFVLGQAILCLIAYAIRKLSTVDVIRSLEQGELTLAVVFAAKLFTAGYVMSSIIAGPSIGLVQDLMIFVQSGLIAAPDFRNCLLLWVAHLWAYQIECCRHRRVARHATRRQDSRARAGGGLYRQRVDVKFGPDTGRSVLVRPAIHKQKGLQPERATSPL